MHEIKTDFLHGRIKKRNVEWLINTVSKQQEIIKMLEHDRKHKKRFKLFLELAQENLELAEEVERLKGELHEQKSCS